MPTFPVTVFEDGEHLIRRACQPNDFHEVQQNPFYLDRQRSRHSSKFRASDDAANEAAHTATDWAEATEELDVSAPVDAPVAVTDAPEICVAWRGR